jgi:hypothetical protein
VTVGSLAAGAGYWFYRPRQEPAAVGGATAPSTPAAGAVDSSKPAPVVQQPVNRRAPAVREKPPAPKTENAAAPAQGFITVNSDPFGTVFIDGVEVGPTPVVRYGVTPGQHAIKVVREGYRTTTENVQVDAGNTVPRRLTLLPEN